MLFICSHVTHRKWNTWNKHTEFTNNLLLTEYYEQNNYLLNYWCEHYFFLPCTIPYYWFSGHFSLKTNCSLKFKQGWPSVWPMSTIFYVSLHFLASKILNKLSLKLTLNIISSFCPIDPVMGHWGIMMEALVIRICHCSLSSAMHTIVKMMHPVHSVMLLSQDCFCLPLLHSPSAVPWEFALERVSGLFSCSNHGRVQISKSIWTVVQWRNLRNRERPWNRSTNYSKVISAVVQPMLYKAIELSWPK